MRSGVSACPIPERVQNAVRPGLLRLHRDGTLDTTYGKGGLVRIDIGGFGDLGKDKFSVLGVFDYYKRDLVKLSDTDFGASRDWRGRAGGGRNFDSLTGLGTWQQYTNAGVATQNFQAVPGCNAAGGTLMTGPQAVAAGLINLSSNQSAATLATLQARAAATNTFCTYNSNNAITALPGTERFGFLGRGTVWAVECVVYLEPVPQVGDFRLPLVHGHLAHLRRVEASLLGGHGREASTTSQGRPRTANRDAGRRRPCGRPCGPRCRC